MNSRMNQGLAISSAFPGLVTDLSKRSGACAATSAPECKTSFNARGPEKREVMLSSQRIQPPHSSFADDLPNQTIKKLS